MKTKLLISFMSIFIFSTCSQNNMKQEEERLSGDCFVQHFITTASLEEYVSEDIFFIMGEVQEVVGYGNRINILEDLRGNYKDKSSITVWGWDCCHGMVSNLMDNLGFYNAGDTLIMLITPRIRLLNDNEKSGDFETITCCHSVLKYSNGSVTGFISIAPEPQTMLWSDLQNQLKKEN